LNNPHGKSKRQLPYYPVIFITLINLETWKAKSQSIKDGKQRLHTGFGEEPQKNENGEIVFAISPFRYFTT